jgi:hypothetical protein
MVQRNTSPLSELKIKPDTKPAIGRQLKRQAISR